MYLVNCSTIVQQLTKIEKLPVNYKNTFPIVLFLNITSEILR